MVSDFEYYIFYFLLFALYDIVFYSIVFCEIILLSIFLHLHLSEFLVYCAATPDEEAKKDQKAEDLAKKQEKIRVCFYCTVPF
jgi:hypothetical protein